jgi:ribosomal protein S25
MTVAAHQKRRRLKPAEVIVLRQRYHDDESITYKQLAEEEHMSVLAMNLLITGKTWDELPGAMPDNRRRGARKGPKHPQSQLTAPQVREMLKDYTKDTTLTYNDFADRFKVSRQVIANAFKHLEDWLPGEDVTMPKRVARGARRGEKHPFARMSDEQIAEMRTLRHEDRKVWTLTTLGTKYDVCPSMVSRVLRGLSRRDAGGPIEGK